MCVRIYSYACGDAHLPYTPNDVCIVQKKKYFLHVCCAVLCMVWSYWLQANNKTYHLPHIHIILSILLDEVESLLKGKENEPLTKENCEN